MNHSGIHSHVDYHLDPIIHSHLSPREISLERARIQGEIDRMNDEAAIMRASIARENLLRDNNINKYLTPERTRLSSN